MRLEGGRASRRAWPLKARSAVASPAMAAARNCCRHGSSSAAVAIASTRFASSDFRASRALSCQSSSATIRASRMAGCSARMRRASSSVRPGVTSKP